MDENIKTLYKALAIYGIGASLTNGIVEKLTKETIKNRLLWALVSSTLETVGTYAWLFGAAAWYMKRMQDLDDPEDEEFDTSEDI